MADKFFLFAEQGGGCDYTIGCGFRLRELKGATTMEEAIAIATSEDKHGEFMIDLEDIDEATIYQVSAQYKLPLAKITAQRRAATLARDKEAERAKKEAEFERLKKELGK